MDDHLALGRAIGEGTVVALLAIASSLLVGFVFPWFRHPITIAVIALSAGLAWTFRPLDREHRYAVLVLLTVLVLSIPFLVAPSFIGHLLPQAGAATRAEWIKSQERAVPPSKASIFDERQNRGRPALRGSVAI